MDREAFFVRLEEESGRTFSETQRQRFAAEIERYRSYYEWNEAYSADARDRLATLMLAIEALKSLVDRPAELHALVYDESVAMGLFFDELPTPDSEGDELLRVLSDLGAKGNVLSKRVSDRLDRLEALRPGGGRPPDMHNYMLCWSLARIFEEGGYEATIDGGSTSEYARSLVAIHDYLPEDIRPSVSEFVESARRALGYKDKSNWRKGVKPSSIGKRRRMRRAQQREHDEQKAARERGEELTPSKAQKQADADSDLALSRAIRQAMKELALCKKRRPSFTTRPSIQCRSSRRSSSTSGARLDQRGERAREPKTSSPKRRSKIVKRAAAQR